jgi:hypothetical protein
MGCDSGGGFASNYLVRFFGFDPPPGVGVESSPAAGFRARRRLTFASRARSAASRRSRTSPTKSSIRFHCAQSCATVAGGGGVVRSRRRFGEGGADRELVGGSGNFVSPYFWNTRACADSRCTPRRSRASISSINARLVGIRNRRSLTPVDVSCQRSHELFGEVEIIAITSASPATVMTTTSPNHDAGHNGPISPDQKQLFLNR